MLYITGFYIWFVSCRSLWISKNCFI